MMDRFYLNTVAFWLILVAVFAGPGCKQQHKADDVLACAPDVNEIVVADDYTPQAIGVTGGYRAWMETKKLELDCVVTFYKPDGSFYLTEQHYEVFPWSNSIRISATEPQGNFVCQLSAGRFDVLEGAGQVCTLQPVVCERYFAQAILDITTSQVRLLESKSKFTKKSTPVKMEGLWYYPIEQASTDVEQYWSKVIYYQSRDSSLVDMLWFADADGKRFFAVRGYDYYEVEKSSVSIPRKIEIFKTNANGVLQQRLVKIDFK